MARRMFDEGHRRSGPAPPPLPGAAPAPADWNENTGVEGNIA
jgi:hypothetical protein